jgi:hypothetical protein
MEIPYQDPRESNSGPSGKRQATSLKKIFDKKITCGMIPYNLKRKENYGLFSIKNTRRCGETNNSSHSDGPART